MKYSILVAILAVCFALLVTKRFFDNKCKTTRIGGIESKKKVKNTIEDDSDYLFFIYFDHKNCFFFPL